MLSLLLLAVELQTGPPPSSVTVIPPSAPGTAVDMPVLGRTPPQCQSQTTLTRSEIASAEDLLWRDSDPQVGLHLLLDRYVGGCPAPIVVGYRSPSLVAQTPESAPEVSRSRRLAD